MKKILSILTPICLVLGIAFGLLFGDLVSYVEFIGVWYVNILKVLIGPVIFTSIALTIYKSAGNKDRLILKSVICFVLMFLCSFILSSLLVSLFNPAGSFSFDSGEWSGQTISFSLKDMLLNLFPKNLKEVFISPKVFFIILISWLFGRVAAFFKGSTALFNALEKLKEWLFKGLEIFMYTTPFAVFSLMAVTASKYGFELLKAGFRYIGAAYLCSLAVVIIVMILPVWLFAGISPKEYIKRVGKIWVLTFTTCSSAATLPYTVKLCKEEFKIPEKITDVVVPLGCTIHMCGGAVSFALLGLFCAKLYGIEMGIGSWFFMALAAMLINMAAPGIPGGGIVIGASYLSMMGIPLGFMGFYSGIYKFLDMVYTTLNVTGDISANILIHALSFKKRG